VTVVDISPRMLELDQRAAAARGLSVRLVESSMDDLSMFSDGSFDAVVQPVSTCYVPEVWPVYREVARVTVAGGLYVSQHKQPACLQAEARPGGTGYILQEPYYRSGPLPAAPEGALHREAGTVEFLHRWQDLLGGLCRAGFVIEDLVEPRHGEVNAAPGSFPHRSAFLPPFVTIKARRTDVKLGSPSKIWVPG
jgi:SAM-dependent methyltransferase